MAMEDTLIGAIDTKFIVQLNRSQKQISGKDVLSHTLSVALSDGTGVNQAKGFFGSIFTATTGGITVSLAHATDPLGAAGDDEPSMDPDGLKLRGLLIQNLDSTNYVTVGLGTNALTSWLGGTTPTVRIPAGGFIFSTFPAGLDALTTGSNDEIELTADTASCSVKISYIFG
jgi:hypothetical protein